MGTQITFRRGSTDPTSGSGITLAEPVFNTNLHTFHIGLGYGVTAEWVGAPISGLSADIAAGITYKIPTLAAVKNYVSSVGTITNYVSSFNGLTGAVTGVTVGGANVFTALNSFNAGICASGITLSSGIINAPSAGLYLTSANTKNAKINLLGGPSSSQVELDAITVRVRNTTDGALPTFELYEATDVYSAKMQYTSSATNDATITFPAITGTVALTNQVVTSVNGQTGAVTVSGGTNVVTSFNGATGAIQGVSSVNGQTGAVTIASVSNVVSSFNGLTGAVTGVSSFNGATGAVTGASLGANTFTGTQTLTAGLTTSYLYASVGSTFASTLQVNGGATFSGRVDIGGNIKVLGDTQLGDASTDALNVYAGTTFQNRTDFGGSNNFNSGLTAAGNINLSGTRSITGKGASLTIKGISTGASTNASNSIVLSGQATTNLLLSSATGIVETSKGFEGLTGAYITGVKLNTDDTDIYGANSSTITAQTYLTGNRFLYVPDDTGTIALTKNVVTSFNGATGAVTGASLGANTFTGLQTLTAGLCADGGITFNGAVTGATATFTRRLTASGGISASGGMTLDGGKVWHSLNDGAGSGLDTDLVRGVCGDRLLEEIQTGLLYGGVITINAGNTAAVDVSAGAGIIVTVNGSTGAFPAPSLQTVTWTAKTGVTLAGMTSSDFTFFRIDSSGNLQQSSSNFSQTQYLNSVVIGNAVHQSRAYVNRVHYHPIVAYASSAQYETFIRYFGPLKVDGYVLSGYGTTGGIQHTTGTAFALGANMDTDPNNPSLVTDSAAVPVQQLFYLYRNADGTYRTDPTSRTTVNFRNYDNGSGSLGNIGNQSWSIQRVYKIPGVNNALYIYYGTASYGTDTVAANNILLETFAEADITRYNGVFLGWLIVRGNGSNVSDTGDCRIVPGGFFRNTTGGGGASTVLNLDDLGDVAVTTPANNQILRYDSAQGLWVNSAVTTLPLVTSFNGVTGAVTGVSSVNGQTGAVTIASATNVVTSFNGLTGAVQGVASFNGLTGAVQGVASFNGLTGAVQGVASFNGLTGTVGITAGSNITISQSGNTFTISSGATATYAVTTSSNANATRYLTFATGACANGTSLYVDDVTTPLSYTPFSGTLNTKNINLVSGADTLNITPTQITASTDFYFFSSAGSIYFDNPNIVSLGDISGINGTVFSINPPTNSAILIDSGGSVAYFGINRDATQQDFALELNSGGNALQLMYATQSGAATTKTDFVMDSTGKLTIAPSGGTLAVTGNLTANNLVYSFNGRTGAVQGVSAAVAGTGISVSGATGSVTITNTGVQSFNGSTGAVQGVSKVNGYTGGITFAAGTGITLTTSANTVTLAFSPSTTTQTVDFSENINGIAFVFYGSGANFGTSLQYVENYKSITASIAVGGTGYSCVVNSIKSFYDPTNGWSARLVTKAPFTNTSTQAISTAETIVNAGVSNITLNLTAASGTVVTDFWSSISSSSVYHQEETYAVKTVTGQSWVTANSYISCKILGITTADHTPEDAILEGVRFEINNIVAGTGFDIIGHAPEGTYGKYTVKCIGE